LSQIFREPDPTNEAAMLDLPKQHQSFLGSPIFGQVIDVNRLVEITGFLYSRLMGNFPSFRQPTSRWAFQNHA
jgi:hypothetical protein